MAEVVLALAAPARQLGAMGATRVPWWAHGLPRGSNVWAGTGDGEASPPPARVVTPASSPTAGEAGCTRPG